MSRPLALVAALAALAAGPATAQGLVIGAPFPNAVGVGDVNGNGYGDLSAWSPPGGGSGTWQVHDGATGAVMPHLTRPWSFGSTYFGVGDVDGDGHDDVCFGASSLDHTVLSGADGSTLLSQPNTVVYGGTDLDGDGRSDLLLTSFGTGSNADTWIRSSRTGAALFSLPWSTAGLQTYRWAVFGDENGDGYGDAALLRFDYFFPGTWELDAVVRGPGGTPVPIGVWAGEPCGDVDGDGAADIAVSTNGGVAQTAYVMAGGSHTTIWTLNTTNRAVGIGGVDGDGHGDVAGTHVATTVYSGATHLPIAGQAPSSEPLALGDFDGDGRVECRVGSDHYEWVDPALPIGSRMVRRGVPGTTSSGRRPTIGTRGHCGLGNTVWFDLRGNEPNSGVLFAIGAAADADLAPLGAPGNRSYTTLAGFTVLSADNHGVVVLPVVMPTTTALLGAAASVQSATFDAAANAFGFVTSNAIDVETRN